MERYISGLVSVIVPTYKRSDSLTRTINSIIKQTYQNIEVIVVNDNQARDEYSLNLYKKLQIYNTDERVKIIEQKKHINGAAARNAGIKAAKGEYIAFLDDDDYWDYRKIEHQIKILKNLDQSWGAVGCMAIHIKDDRPLYVSLPYKDGYIFNEIMQRKIGLGTGSLLMRRKAIDEAGYFDESLSRHQDIQFFGYFSYKYKIKLLKEYLYYIDHDDPSNRPNLENIKKNKQAFYNSVIPLINTMSETERNKFYIMNDFEIAIAEFKIGKIIEALKRAIKVFRYHSTLFGAIGRVLYRVIGKKCKRKYIIKYFPN